MKVLRHVNVLLALTAIGVVGCGAGGNGSGGTDDENGTGNTPPTGQNPGGSTPVGSNPTGSQPGGSTPTGTTTPPTGTTTPPTGTTTPPTGTTTPPTGTTTPPTGTTTPPTGTTTPPVGTTTPPTTGDTGPVPGANYDANGVLLAPDPSLGLQIVTPTFTLNPGDEVFKCFHTIVPKNSEIDVHRFVSQMTPGSHHFILYAESSDSEAASNTLDNTGCLTGVGAQWVYASSSVDNYTPMPDGVAMPMIANQPLAFDMHYINTGTTSLPVHITLNLELATGTFQKAGALVSFNTSINIPPNGTQTVSGSCAAPAGAQFFIASTHTHKHATVATIDKAVNGQITQELVHTTDWEHPAVGSWGTPPYMTFASNEQVYYSCSYQNDTSAAITVGTSAIKNEMCMAILYFFPTPAGWSSNVGNCGSFGF
jgi:hypothetical protein